MSSLFRPEFPSPEIEQRQRHRAVSIGFLRKLETEAATDECSMSPKSAVSRLKFRTQIIDSV